MAHIRRHPVDRTRWQVRYRDPSGKERSKTFPRRVEAERYLINVEAQKLGGEWINPDLASTAYRIWAAKWMENRLDLKPKTLHGYDEILRNLILPQFGEVALGRIDSLMVASWLAEMQASGRSPSRIRQAFFLLSSSLKAAVRNRWLAHNPADGANLPKMIRREMRFLDPSEIDMLTQAVGAQWRVLVLLLAYGGLRWGEAAAVRRSRCDLLRARIEIREAVAEVGGRLYFGPPKTYQSRTLVLPSFLRDELAAHLATNVENDPDALIFTAAKGGPLRLSNFRRRVWRPAVETSGLGPGLRIHDLRHSCAAC